MTSLLEEKGRALAFASAGELLGLLARREFTSRELLEFFLDRVGRLNASINAIIYMDVAQARARADEADAATRKGQRWGALHGLPMTVKETHNVAGWPTTYGDPALKDFVPAQNAAVIERLQAAGAIVFGKTNVPINALDWQSYNAIYGTTRNPWDLERTPGGSSGGSSAALAAGLVPLELGSDAGGSIRFPSHFCGVFGHKPTPGIVPVFGNERGRSLLDNDLVTAGPMARSAADLSLALDVVAGAAGPAAAAWRLELPKPRKTRLKDFRVSVVTDSPVAEVDEPYRAAIRSFAARVRAEGAEVIEERLPFTDHAAHHETYVQLLRGSASVRLPDLEFQAAVRWAAEPDRNASRYVQQSMRAYTQRHRDYIKAEEQRARLKRDWAAFFEKIDLVVAPVTTCAAFPLDEAKPREQRTLRINGHSVDYNDQLFWAGLATLPSLPSTVVPIGLADGLPVGVQVIGPYLDDRTTLAFASELERIYPFVPPPAFA